MTVTEPAGSVPTDEGLPPFEGRRVDKSTIQITRAGDGLSEALAVDPRALHHGDVVYVVLETVVADVRHPVVKGYDADEPDAPLVRQHSLRTETATIVDHELVRQHLEQQRDRIQRAKEEAQGIQRLPVADAEDDWES